MWRCKMENKENKRTASFTAKVSGEEYQPYVPAEANIKEFTVRAIVIGCILACLFGAANLWRSQCLSGDEDRHDHLRVYSGSSHRHGRTEML